MPGTKIINVQKNDSFDEVFDAFKTTEAKEVIFIFPRGTVFGKDTGHFDTIKQEAEASGKLVNVMTTDPVIAHVAAQYGLGILQNPAPRRRAVAAVAPAPSPIPPLMPEPEPEPAPEPELPHETENSSSAFLEAQQAFAPERNNIYADLAVARKPVSRKEVIPPAPSATRKVKDIMPAPADFSMEVESTPEEEVPLPVSRASVIPRPASPASPPMRMAPINAPQASVQPQVDIETMWKEEEQRVDPNGDQGEKPARKKIFGNISKKFIFIPVVAAVLVLGAILYVTVGKAKITVVPKSQDIDLTLKITTSADIDEIDADANKIPGQSFSIEKTASGSYPTSSEKEVAQKASGTITISNTSGASQRLVATTRFESKGGLIFRIPETITVPAGNTAKPGTISTTVYADRAGKEYNIAATTFTIPGFKDTPHYAEFSAVSKTAMTGGAVGTAKVVSEGDYTKAKTELSASAKDQVAEALKEQTGSLKVIEDAAITVLDPKSNGKVGEAADPLTMGVTAVAKVTAFQEADVLDLVTRYISKNGDLELVRDGLEVTYTVVNSDPAAKTLTFEVQVKGRAAAKLNRDKILKDVQGMNGSALQSYFHSQDNVETAKILFSPFWVTKVPGDPKKVELIIDIKG